jgi:hypothetical protein
LQSFEQERRRNGAGRGEVAGSDGIAADRDPRESAAEDLDVVRGDERKAGAWAPARAAL